jgi:hypothetical protein
MNNSFIWYAECINTGKLELLWGVSTPVTSVLLPNKQLLCYRNHRYARLKRMHNVARYADYNPLLIYATNFLRSLTMELLFRYSDAHCGPYRVYVSSLLDLDNQLFLCDSSTMNSQSYYIVVT